jgi:hypothetical protein
MKKAKLKTSPTKLSVKKYLDSIEDPSRRADCDTIAKLMRSETKSAPIMWGKSIVGFGKQEMTYASGRKVDWLIMGFSSRKDSISIYLTCDLDEMKDELKQLGKHKRGVGCLYVKKLADIDLKVLKKMMKLAKKRANTA